MKKIFFLALLLIPHLSLAQSGPNSITMGSLFTDGQGDQVKEYSISNRFGAWSFNLPFSKTLSKIWWMPDYIGGTPTARFDVYATSSGTVGSSVANSSTLSGTPAANTYLQTTGFSYAMTAGTTYWIGVRNPNGTPGTNYFALRVNRNQLRSSAGYGSNPANFFFRESVDSGTSWTNDSYTGSFPFVLEFSDGTYWGVNQGELMRSADASTTYRVYSSREGGAYFTTPAGPTINVCGVSFNVAKRGTPTGSLRYRLYAGTTLLDTTASQPVDSITSGSQTIPLFFSAAVALAPATIHRAVVSETTQSDASSNGFDFSYKENLSSDSNLQALKPWGSTEALTYYDGSSWAQSTTRVVPFELILCDGNQFAASSGGGRTQQTNLLSGGL